LRFEEVADGVHGIVIIYGAGWHNAKSLIAPGNFSLLRLPAYSLELNPQENIWQFLRQNLLANRIHEATRQSSPRAAKLGTT
jgi:hypothetical protein